jgi:hypothetical protein
MLRIRRAIGVVCLVFGGPMSLVFASCTDSGDVLPAPSIGEAGSEDAERLDSPADLPPDGAEPVEDGARSSDAANDSGPLKADAGSDAGRSEAGVPEAGGRDATVDAS